VTIVIIIVDGVDDMNTFSQVVRRSIATERGQSISRTGDIKCDSLNHALIFCVSESVLY
jgi:hypothetical protein